MYYSLFFRPVKIMVNHVASSSILLYIWCSISTSQAGPLDTLTSWARADRIPIDVNLPWLPCKSFTFIFVINNFIKSFTLNFSRLPHAAYLHFVTFVSVQQCLMCVCVYSVTVHYFCYDYRSCCKVINDLVFII